MINLDTHILINALSDELKFKVNRQLEGIPRSISAIVLLELVKLVQPGRVEINLTAELLPRFDTARFPKRPGR